MRKTTTLSLLLVVGLSSCRTTRLVDPDPISLTDRGEVTRATIIDAMLAQSRAISQEEPGRIHAILVVNGNHEMQVLLSYDKDSVRIEYEDSKNIKYSRRRSGAEFIHKNYNV